jgi:hypothetical protein
VANLRCCTVGCKVLGETVKGSCPTGAATELMSESADVLAPPPPRFLHRTGYGLYIAETRTAQTPRLSRA